MALPNPGWSVVAFEVPTAAKWNQLGENDDALADGSGLDDGAVIDTKWRNEVAFRANVNATQNTGNATFADMSFATEQYDIGADFASSQFTAPVNGVYHFSGSCGTNTNSTRLIISLFDSTNSELIRGSESTSSSNVASTGASFSGDISLTAGTIVKCRTFGNTTLTLTTDTARNWFSGHLVTRT